MKFPDLKQGLCREVGSTFFFPELGDETSARVAKAICSNCPVIKECGDWAIRHEEHGIWGGLSPRDRMKVRKVFGIRLDTLLSGDYQ